MWKMETGVTDQGVTVKREQDPGSKDKAVKISKLNPVDRTVKQNNTKVPVKMKAGSINVTVAQLPVSVQGMSSIKVNCL